MPIVETVKLPPSPRVPAAGVTSNTSDEKLPGIATEPYADRAPAAGGGTVVGKGIIVVGFASMRVRALGSTIKPSPPPPLPLRSIMVVIPLVGEKL